MERNNLVWHILPAIINLSPFFQPSNLKISTKTPTWIFIKIVILFAGEISLH